MSGAAIQRIPSRNTSGSITSVPLSPMAIHLRLALGDCQPLEHLDGAADSHTWSHLSPVRAVAFGTDARMLAFATRNSVKVGWNVRGLIHTLDGHSSPVHAVAFHPNGKVMLLQRGLTIKLWMCKRQGDSRSNGPFQMLPSLAVSPEASSLRREHR